MNDAAHKGVRSTGKWIPEHEYDEIAKKLPILCVDLLPIHPGPQRLIGLMLRQTFWGGRGWSLVGGGVQHGEPAAHAVERVVDWALGDRVELDRSTLELKDAVEYFPERGVGEFFDPRKHAVALTYTCVMSGEPIPRGKALDFRWFPPEDLPAPGDIGFGQASLIPRLLNT